MGEVFKAILDLVKGLEVLVNLCVWIGQQEDNYSSYFLSILAFLWNEIGIAVFGSIRGIHLKVLYSILFLFFRFLVGS